MAGPPVKLVLDDYAAEGLGRALQLEGFFPEFKAEHALKLFPRGGLYAYPAGAVLIEQGSAGRDLFVIYVGAVSVRQTFGSAAAELAQLKAGDVLGEMALLTAAPRTATAVALQDSQVFRLSFEDLQYLLRHNAALAAHLQSLAARRKG